MKNNLDILFSDDFCQSVEENLSRDPLSVALDSRLPHAAQVASQVKYLRRAESKLPSFHAARCIVPPLAFEQASSEATAARRVAASTGMGQRVGVALDLTCGLGVDSWELSKRFERVIALERDAELAAIARENFRRLGARNITVVAASAEEFLAGELSAGGLAGTLPPEGVELVYADPDRRGARGHKMVRMEDCSPDVVALLPLLRRITPRLTVKLSPLFDVDEVFRIFGRVGGDILSGGEPSVGVDVISLGGECKEIVADVEFGSRAESRVRAVAIGLCEAEYPVRDNPARTDCMSPVGAFEPEAWRYLTVPDVALQKGRLARRYLSEHGVWAESDNGYGFSESKPRGDGGTGGGLMGRVFEIAGMEPLDPKELARRLKGRGVKGVDIMKRDFPLPTAEIARRLGVREGGTVKIAFTRAAGRLWQIELK